MPQKAGEAGHAYALSWGGELFLVWEVSLGADSSLVLSAGNSTYCRPLQPTLPCLGLETQGRILGQL